MSGHSIIWFAIHSFQVQKPEHKKTWSPEHFTRLYVDLLATKRSTGRGKPYDPVEPGRGKPLRPEPSSFTGNNGVVGVKPLQKEYK